MLIALHIIFEGVTGKLIFATPNVENFLQSKDNYHLFGSDNVHRVGSFFIQPDASSAFLAMMIFIPLGLFVDSTSMLKKGFYLAETALLMIALLFTYSTAAFLAVSVGIIAFMLLTGSIRHSLLILLGIGGVVTAALFFFSSQVNLLLVHASNPNDLILRQGLWETACRIILAFPLTGIGLSRLTYQITSEYFRVATATTSINNPHNSYLELGALGGIPVLLVFIALLAFCFWYALCNWRYVDGRKRALFGAGIASMIALVFNSWSFGVWTLPPLAVSGWFIFGVIASPLVIRKMNQPKTQEKQL
jgi:O-antigen ligase